MSRLERRVEKLEEAHGGGRQPGILIITDADGNEHIEVGPFTEAEVQELFAKYGVTHFTG